MTVASIASPELGSRALANSPELRLSPDQVASIIDVVGAWRRRYIELAEEIVRLGNDTDRALNNFDIDTGKVKELAARRREVVAWLEDEFVDAWVAYQKNLDPTQYQRLIEVYQREFRELPHPILGAKTMHGAIARPNLCGSPPWREADETDPGNQSSMIVAVG